MVVTLDDLHGERAETVEGLKEAALLIAEKIYALPNLERCVPETFPRAVRDACDWWIDEIGEEAYGQPWTRTMRNNFYSLMLESIGKAFCIEGYE